ncbi:MAG: NTP transferase domain-containing protein [Deltaproteobacteria bacterium]|nr:NTP transferase domain-containing protein [Deltaproteobacteria bacterium]
MAEIIFDGIILAAGEGRRMGLPKALLEIGGARLALLQRNLLMDAGCGSVATVIGSEARRVRDGLGDFPGIVENPDFKDGQFSSLVKGLLSINPERWAVVLPVDVFPVQVQTVKFLMEKASPPLDAVSPVFDGRSGHPVILSPKLCALIRAMPPASSRLDLVLRSCRRAFAGVYDKAVASNLNRPEDARC